MSDQSFSLFETLRWDPGEGFFLLEGHLERLAASASRLGFRPAREAVAMLEQAVAGAGVPLRLRLLLDPDGTVRVTSAPLVEGGGAVWRLAVATDPVDRSDPSLNHKTTQRDVYERARRAYPDVDDVVLHDREDRVTETTIANIVIEREGRRVTPAGPGLLPGVFRHHLLERGEIIEGEILVDELQRTPRIWLINSVRRWVPATLV